MSAPSFILTYHSLDPSGSVISVAPESFRQHLELLEGNGRPVTSLDAVLTTPGAIALTFDDGFQNFYEHAFPVLCEKRFPATVFVVTGHCGGANNWQSQSSGIVPELKLMGWSQLNELRRHGISLGGHTVTHPHLTEVPLAAAEQEIRDCRAAIEDRTGEPVRSFAYPYGSANARVRELAAQYFPQACGTELGFVRSGADPLLLPRLDVYYLRRLRLFGMLCNRRGEMYIGLRRHLRTIRSTAQALRA